MIDLLFLIIYLFLFIYSILLLFKKKKKWISLIIVNILSIISSCFFMVYFDNLPGYGFMPGLCYLGEVLINFIFLILFLILLSIIIILKIIEFEKQEKKKEKKFYSPFYLIIVFIFLIISSYNFIHEIYNNKNIKKTTGIVTGFKKEKYYEESNNITKELYEYNPIIYFKVNGKKYYDDIYKDYFKKDLNINDKVNIYYNSHYKDEYFITSLEDNKIVYIPLFTISIIMLFIRFKKK